MTAGKEVSTPGRDGTSTPGGAGPAPPGEFRLDPASGVPAYLQLVQQVEHALRLGCLRTGDQLPAVKDLAASLKINPDTVRVHEEIADAVVIAVADATWGDRLEAFAVRRTASGLATDELLLWMREKLPAYRVPRAVHWLSEIPVDRSGKTSLRTLRQLAAAYDTDRRP